MKPARYAALAAGDGRPLVRAARAHLDERSAVRGGHHPGGGRGDRAVVVKHRERDRLQDHRLGERALDHENRRAGEVAVALGVAPDVPAELVVAQEVKRRPVSDLRALEEGKLGVAEPESLQRVQQPAGAGDNAVATAVRQVPGEHLEHGAPVRGPALQRRAQHGQLVMVGEQGGADRVGDWHIGTGHVEAGSVEAGRVGAGHIGSGRIAAGLVIGHQESLRIGLGHLACWPVVGWLRHSLACIGAAPSVRPAG